MRADAMSATKPLMLGEGEKRDAYGLVIAWSQSEPGRAGEIAFVVEGERAQILGRGDGFRSDLERTAFYRHRPGVLMPTSPLVEQGISREQLRMRARSDGIEVESIGRCPLLVNNKPEFRVLVEAGDTVHLKGQLLLYCVRRPMKMSLAKNFSPDAIGTFGEVDGIGLVGESPPAWKLREGIAQIARSERHVLIAGELGTERDLVLRAVHGFSRRANMHLSMVAAETAPIVELGRILRGQPPAPGAPIQRFESTLILDEIGDMSPEQVNGFLSAIQAGPHRRKTPYPADGPPSSQGPPPLVRVLATTSHDPYELAPELLAKLTPALIVPALDARREDVPLLAKHLLWKAAERTPSIADRFFDPNGVPRLDPALLDRLLRHNYDLHVTELEKLLERAMAWSPGDAITLTREVEKDLVEAATPLAQLVFEPISRRAMLACIHKHDGNLTQAARELGLPSRFALYRLLKKHNIDINTARG